MFSAIMYVLHLEKHKMQKIKPIISPLRNRPKVYKFIVLQMKVFGHKKCQPHFMKGIKSVNLEIANLAICMDFEVLLNMPLLDYVQNMSLSLPNPEFRSIQLKKCLFSKGHIFGIFILVSEQNRFK